MKIYNLFIGLTIALSCLSACSDDAEDNFSFKEIKFNIDYPGSGNNSRATSSSFEKDDNIGLFMTASDSPLEIGGNFMNNEKITFDGNVWKASKTLYWNDGVYNVYAYYPYTKTVSSIEDFPFSVSTDQNSTKNAEELGGYEASDFLYASNKGVVAADNSVNLIFKHIMTKLSIRLVKGEDFEGDMPDKAEVYIHNTVPTATIDLNAGIATKDVYGTKQTIRAKEDGNYTYSAIIVPQRISNRIPLIEVIMNNVSYLYETTFLFKPGMQQFINLVITDNPDQAKIEIGGEVQNWE